MSALQALSPERRLLTNAGPQLEVALHSQGHAAYVLGLINLSGHHGTAFFDPVPMRDLVFELALPLQPTSAASLRLDADLEVWHTEGRTCLRLERLDLFDTIRLV
jgi:hypothetical protein